jgi:hypothetical protein
MKGHKRYRSGAWRLVVHTGVGPATGRRRSIHETVHGPENRAGAKAANARLAELIAAVESGREIERSTRRSGMDSRSPSVHMGSHVCTPEASSRGYCRRRREAASYVG